jgi:hypothetical protein
MLQRSGSELEVVLSECRKVLFQNHTAEMRFRNWMKARGATAEQEQDAPAAAAAAGAGEPACQALVALLGDTLLTKQGVRPTAGVLGGARDRGGGASTGAAAATASASASASASAPAPALASASSAGLTTSVGLYFAALGR